MRLEIWFCMCVTLITRMQIFKKPSLKTEKTEKMLGHFQVVDAQRILVVIVMLFFGMNIALYSHVNSLKQKYE